MLIPKHSFTCPAAAGQQQAPADRVVDHAVMNVYAVQDWQQQQQRHKAALETELKSLRSQIGEACFAFDQQLLQLKKQRFAAESELATLELQHVSLAAFYEQQQYLKVEAEKVAKHITRVQQELHIKQRLVNDVLEALAK